MRFPRFVELTPLGDLALKHIEEGIERLRALPRDAAKPKFRVGTVDYHVTGALAKFEAHCAALRLFLLTELTPDVREDAQQELDNCMCLMAFERKDIVEDQGGYLVWLWISGNTPLMQQVDRFKQ